MPTPRWEGGIVGSGKWECGRGNCWKSECGIVGSGNFEVGPVVVPKERDYAAARMRKSELLEVGRKLKTNTRLPCKVRWFYGIIELLIKSFKLTHTHYKALRAGRILLRTGVEGMEERGVRP